MNFSSTPVTYLIILANIIVSYRGFQNLSFLERYLFKPLPILRKNQYTRLLSSGFLHADWMHLIFNMYSLFSFGVTLEMATGSIVFTILYFASLIGGNLLSLLLHRHDSEYSALGASGAVSGVLFATIVAIPEMRVSIFIFPSVPGWIFALLYIGFSLYGIRNNRDNIGHDAHLGGAIIGTLTLIGFFPFLIEERSLLLTFILVPSVIFLVMMVYSPQILGLPATHLQKKRLSHLKDDDNYNAIRAEKQKELNRILDKINESGMDSLSDYEKRFLDMNR